MTRLVKLRRWDNGLPGVVYLRVDEIVIFHPSDRASRTRVVTAAGEITVAGDADEIAKALAGSDPNDGVPLDLTHLADPVEAATGRGRR